MKDRVAIITGGGGDLGRATAVTLAKRGARVLAVDLNEAGLEETAREVRRLGGAIEVHRADVTDSEQVRGYARRALELWGGIDAFFNNAGIEGPVAPIVEYAEADFDRVIAVNLRGVFLGLKHVMPRMKRGGAILNMSSVAGLRGFAGLCAYVASKHAVVGLTRVAAIEGAELGLRVNSIHPGPIEGRMMVSIEQEAFGERKPEAYAERVPLGRYGTPQEVASLAAFLLSDEASYLNGGIYLVDGGMMA